jgi:hypothetical protein
MSARSDNRTKYFYNTHDACARTQHLLSLVRQLRANRPKHGNMSVCPKYNDAHPCPYIHTRALTRTAPDSSLAARTTATTRREHKSRAHQFPKVPRQHTSTHSHTHARCTTDRHPDDPLFPALSTSTCIIFSSSSHTTNTHKLRTAKFRRAGTGVSRDRGHTPVSNAPYHRHHAHAPHTDLSTHTPHDSDDARTSLRLQHPPRHAILFPLQRVSRTDSNQCVSCVSLSTLSSPSSTDRQQQNHCALTLMGPSLPFINTFATRFYPIFHIAVSTISSSSLACYPAAAL